MKKIYTLICFVLLTTSVFAKTTMAAPIQNFTTVVANQQDTSKIKASYHQGKLTVTGINSITTISIYNLLGKKVANFQNVSIRGKFSKYIDLPKNNIYIINLTSEKFNKTFKILSK